jgi:hypothetical protein
MTMILSKWMIAFLLLLSFSGCERRTRVRLEGGNPPTFVLSGSGVLGGFVIYRPEAERVGSLDDKNNIAWEIEAKQMPGELVERLGSITYGAVPNGYRQVIPGSGEPPLLKPAKRYRYWVVTGNAPGVIGHFEVRDGVAVVVDGSI